MTSVWHVTDMKPGNCEDETGAGHYTVSSSLSPVIGRQLSHTPTIIVCHSISTVGGSIFIFFRPSSFTRHNATPEGCVARRPLAEGMAQRYARTKLVNIQSPPWIVKKIATSHFPISCVCVCVCLCCKKLSTCNRNTTHLIVNKNIYLTRSKNRKKL